MSRRGDSARTAPRRFSERICHVARHGPRRPRPGIRPTRRAGHGFGDRPGPLRRDDRIGVGSAHPGCCDSPRSADTSCDRPRRVRQRDPRRDGLRQDRQLHGAAGRGTSSAATARTARGLCVDTGSLVFGDGVVPATGLRVAQLLRPMLPAGTGLLQQPASIDAAFGTPQGREGAAGISRVVVGSGGERGVGCSGRSAHRSTAHLPRPWRGSRSVLETSRWGST